MIDLADPALYGSGDPVPVWARLRRDNPVYRNVRPDGSSFWAITAHHLVSEVLRDHVRFTSEPGMQLDADPTATRAAAGKMLIVTDPPRHGKIRRVINTAFTPKMVRRLETHMAETVSRALDDALDMRELDFTDLSGRLPVSVICDMLGVPKADWDFMLQHTGIAFGDTDDHMAKVAAHAEIIAYYADLVDQRRQQPGDDIITALATAVVDGEPLTDEEIFLNCDGLISGGNETTRHATTAGVLALIRHEQQWERLRADVSSVDTAVLEILRFTSPGLHVLRTARQDLRLGDESIGEGERVALWIPAANRDERVFDHGDRFDIGRDARKHLTFGAGTHFCLGSALATQELATFFGQLVRRVRWVELTGPVRWLSSTLIWGIESMPVRLH